VRAALAASMLVLLACALAASIAAGTAASRVIDRTFVCQTGYLGGVYQIEAWASTAGQKQGRARKFSFVSVNTNLPDGFLGGIESNAVWVNRLHCRPTSVKPALSRVGLRGGGIGISEQRVDCFTPRKLLFRVRGEFVRPTALHDVSPFGYPELRAVGAVRTAELGVTSESGRRIAYASIDPNRRTLLSTARDCTED
jgi:hypothetical protein